MYVGTPMYRDTAFQLYVHPAKTVSLKSVFHRITISFCTERQSIFGWSNITDGSFWDTLVVTRKIFGRGWRIWTHITTSSQPRTTTTSWTHTYDCMVGRTSRSYGWQYHCSRCCCDDRHSTREDLGADGPRAKQRFPCTWWWFLSSPWRDSSVDGKWWCGRTRNSPQGWNGLRTTIMIHSHWCFWSNHRPSIVFMSLLDDIQMNEMLQGLYLNEHGCAMLVNYIVLWLL
jgi:hypothetical protein